MREAAFIKKNMPEWQKLSQKLDAGNFRQAEIEIISKLYVRLTNDLAYAQTYFPNSDAHVFLNSLSLKCHQLVYANKKEPLQRFINFWKMELPTIYFQIRKELLISFLVFVCAALIGVFKTIENEEFPRYILGDYYVNTTIQNIESGDPLAIYKKSSQLDMFFSITLNNIKVAFNTFAFGIIFCFGSIYILVINGVMLGTFQYFFFQYNLGQFSILTIWIHGTIEISAIIIAGACGLKIGNSFMFPGTLPRLYGLKAGAKTAVKGVVGLVPFFIIAGFLESFITRKTEWPDAVRLLIIIASLLMVLFYFVYYPFKLHNKQKTINHEQHSV